jgi:hypothetical protein
LRRQFKTSGFVRPDFNTFSTRAANQVSSTANCLSGGREC